MTMATVQKTETRACKEEVARLVQASGKAITQVARELGICDPSLHHWRKELAQPCPEAFPGQGHHTTLEEENRRLKRERVHQERDR
jgi:transposase